jgi:hypothetical protein
LKKQVHDENGVGSRVNITAWWSEESQRDLPNACTAIASAPGGDCYLFNLEAVFPVFVFQKLGDIVSLCAQIGGSFSLIMSTFGFLALVYIVLTKRNLDLVGIVQENEGVLPPRLRGTATVGLQSNNKPAVGVLAL